MLASMVTGMTLFIVMSTLEMLRDFTRSRRPFWVTSSGQMMVILDNKEPKKIHKNTHNFVVSAAPAHGDVITLKHFPCYWPFVRGIHRSPVDSPHKGQWSGALMFSLICSSTNGWAHNRDAGDLRRHRAHYDVTVKWWLLVIYMRSAGNARFLHRYGTGTWMVIKFFMASYFVTAWVINILCRSYYYEYKQNAACTILVACNVTRIYIRLT